MNKGKIKGRIIEIQGNSMILLTKDGQFIQRPLPPGNFQVGEQLELPLPGFNRFLGPLVSAASAATAAAMIGLLLLQSIGASAAPAYYVHVDINPGTPSVELALAQNLRVVEAKPLNDAGEKILLKASLDQKSVRSAIKNLVNTADSMHYIAPGKESTVLISVAGSNRDTEIKKKQIIREVEKAAKRQLKAAKTSATIGVATVDSNTLKQALNNKGSINSLLVNKSKGKKNLPEEYEVSKVAPRRDKPSVKQNDSQNKHTEKEKYKWNKYKWNKKDKKEYSGSQKTEKYRRQKSKSKNVEIKSKVNSRLLKQPKGKDWNKPRSKSKSRALTRSRAIFPDKTLSRPNYRYRYRYRYKS